MLSRPIIDEDGADANLREIPSDHLQKPNIYNRYLPLSESIQRRALAIFGEIRENLSRAIQFGELEPGFAFWSKKLEQYLSLFGFNFTKADHLKLVHLCEMESIAMRETSKENLAYIRSKVGMSHLSSYSFEALLQQLAEVCGNSKWHARRAAIEFTQNMVFCNLFTALPYAEELRQLVRQRLFDEQFEVRITALRTLSGFYQCGYLKVTTADLKYFCAMIGTSNFTALDGKKVISSASLAPRHGGILGLCAIVFASPYNVPEYVPAVLMLLCKHSHEPALIQRSIENCLAEFRRTHLDSWHEHREQFTEDQLAVLADGFTAHNYYA